MRVQCAGCQAAFSVPDEKIPEGKEIRILCPKCRAPIQLIRQEDHAEIEEGENEFSLSEDDYPAAFVGDDQATILVCVSSSSYLSSVQRSFGVLDYNVKVASSARAALSELRHNRYDVVILDEEFDGTTRDTNPVLLYIQPLPMQIRRQFYLCLISTSLQTYDQLAAFRVGADLTINSRDLNRSKLVLDRTMKEHKRFYKVLRNELDARGRV